MTGSHIGHNSVVGDGVTLANGACVAGHASIGDGCFLSACSAVHQFCHVGELVMFQFGAGISQHAPSFVLLANGINRVIGLNRVGLLRSTRFSPDDRADLKQAYKLLFRGRDERMLGEALREAESRQWGRCATLFLDFVREAISWDPPRRRGICGPYRRERRQPEPTERLLDVD
jgi:UDP-N-acetylglucosamine acyltransferase